MIFTGFSLKKSVQSLKRYPARFRRNLSEYRFIAYLAVLGPGIIAANAGNDASGIATYSTVGAGYGYSMLWLFVPMTIALIVVQEMCVRMGVVTGQGLADLIREQFGVRLTALVMFALLIANTGVIISEFVGISQASELFGIPRYFTIPVASGLIWWLVVKGSQKRVERVFLLMSLVFFGYVISAFLSKPDWETVGKEFVEPSFSLETGYLFTLIAVIGTTITPFMQVFVQSSVVEKRMDEEDLPLVRADVIVGILFACMIAGFIVISTAATLHTQGSTNSIPPRLPPKHSRRLPEITRNIFSASDFSARQCWRWAFCRWQRLIRSAKHLDLKKDFREVSAKHRSFSEFLRL